MKPEDEMKKGNVEYLAARRKIVGNAGETVGQQFEETSKLIHDLKLALARSEQAFQGLKDQIEILERWMEYYQRRLAMAGKLSEGGTQLLAEVRDRLKHATDSLKRREEERLKALARRQGAATRSTDGIDRIFPMFDIEPQHS
jgi:hypothetical protein